MVLSSATSSSSSTSSCAPSVVPLVTPLGGMTKLSTDVAKWVFPLFCRVLYCISSPRIVAKLLSSAILHDAEAWRDVDLIITCPEGLFLYQNEIKSILCHTSFPISYIDEMHLLWSAKDFRQSMEFVRGFLMTCFSKLVEMTGTFDSVMLSFILSFYFERK